MQKMSSLRCVEEEFLDQGDMTWRQIFENTQEEMTWRQIFEDSQEEMTWRQIFEDTQEDMPRTQICENTGKQQSVMENGEKADEEEEDEEENRVCSLRDESDYEMDFEEIWCRWFDTYGGGQPFDLEERFAIFASQFLKKKHE